MDNSISFLFVFLSTGQKDCMVDSFKYLLIGQIWLMREQETRFNR